MVYYPSEAPGSVNNKVVIPANQTQMAVGSTAHIGASGDCGVAIAKKISTGYYKFSLLHKASILAFTPYSTLNLASSIKVNSITFTADEVSNGTCQLPNTEEGHLDYKSGGTTSTKVTLNYDNSIPSAQANNNAVYMVIKPGTYTNVKITYNVTDKDNATGWSRTVTTDIVKTYPGTTTFKENDLMPVRTDLDNTLLVSSNVKNYTEEKQSNYYTWGAKEPYPSSGIALGESAANYSINFPDPAPTTTLVGSCPNVNELRWYVEKGDPTWDDKAVWFFKGHLYMGGIWLKKQSVIANEHTSGNVAKLQEAAPDGKNYVVLANDGNAVNAVWKVMPAKLSSHAIDTSKYFFLPALGDYLANGNYRVIGYACYYWSKSSYARFGSYYLCASNGSEQVQVNNIARNLGLQVWTAQ